MRLTSTGGVQMYKIHSNNKASGYHALSLRKSSLSDEKEQLKSKQLLGTYCVNASPTNHSHNYFILRLIAQHFNVYV